MVDVVHAGSGLPLARPLQVRSDLRAAVESGTAVGACRVAAALARATGAGGYITGSVARCVLDFDRPAGVGAEPGQRAMGPPVVGLLDPDQRRRLAGPTYRRGLEVLARRWQGARLAISVFDAEVARPRIRSAAAADPLDPLLPAVLLERLVDPFLVAEILERGDGRLDEEDGPLLPADRLAPRAVAHAWFAFLQARMERVGQGRGEPLDPAGRRLWSALLDTSRLSAETAAVRAYLLEGLAPPPHALDIYARMGALHLELVRWVQERLPDLVRSFLRRPDHRDHLVLEVPADLPSSSAEELARAVAAALEAARPDQTESRR